MTLIDLGVVRIAKRDMTLIDLGVVCVEKRDMTLIDLGVVCIEKRDMTLIDLKINRNHICTFLPVQFRDLNQLHTCITGLKKHLICEVGSH